MKQLLFPTEKEINSIIRNSKNVIDLGCGNNPIFGAKTAVDFHIDPIERSEGNGLFIDTEKMKQKGINFINSRIDVKLPFKDKEFDLAYSHHCFEHLENPSVACDEMMRIAKAGVIIVPSFFAELIFGRKYHKWMIAQRENLLIFLHKREFEYCPFGNHPMWDENNKRWTHDENTNPFDILLNEGGWYNGPEKLDRLSIKLKKYYYNHHPIMEVVFLWEDNFEYKIYE